MGKYNTPEDRNIEYLKTRYMYEERMNTYIANELTNQVWDRSDTDDFTKAWNNNWSIGEIAEYLGADKWEIYLLAIDLLQRQKIDGNIHIFKPKNKNEKEVETVELVLGDHIIRVVISERETWVCLKDVWRLCGKPEHSYRKATETWGPEHRAKFQLQTPGGNQRYIFINMSGLSRLCEKLNKKQKKKIGELVEIMNNGILPVFKGEAIES